MGDKSAGATTALLSIPADNSAGGEAAGPWAGSRHLVRGGWELGLRGGLAENRR
jgi:hypothetical protein